MCLTSSRQTAQDSTTSMPNFTNEEMRIVKYALQERIDRMYRDADAYKNVGNVEAQKDCLNEVRLAQNLLNKIQNEK